MTTLLETVTNRQFLTGAVVGILGLLAAGHFNVI